MSDKKDELRECIAREFEEIAREEEELLKKDTDLVVPEGTKEAVLARVKEQIRAYQQEQAEKEAKEREDAVNHLSEEDRKALELGRKMLKAEVGQTGQVDSSNREEKKIHYRRKPLKIYLALAAVIVCVMAMGITSMGGPERVVRMVKQAVGDRDVEQSDSNKGKQRNKIIMGEDEEESYQEIRDAFGTDVVKIATILKGMEFDTINLDKDNQVAELYYIYNKKTVAYFINVPYRESSWGTDIEDPVEKEYSKKVNGCKIDITLYKADKSGWPRCRAKFTYNSIDYLITGTMSQEDFEKLLKNLIFPS